MNARRKGLRHNRLQEWTRPQCEDRSFVRTNLDLKSGSPVSSTGICCARDLIRRLELYVALSHHQNKISSSQLVFEARVNLLLETIVVSRST
jgi:hypothetical protein